jgi:Heparinase II/III-like protein
VLCDGVDFEASAPYHRLVGELFALPALLRRAHGLPVSDAYVARVGSTARFTLAYTGPDGLAPLWGDNDDGRALPLGGQDVNDHRSLPVLAAALAGEAAPGNAEGAWLVGPAHVAEAAPTQTSAAFPDGGVYVLRSGADHVFVDCGPVGLAGRGGHGHNDCLSFEATLAGRKLFTDSGSYVYTASPVERNRFRGTAAHNTPQVDGEEQNRIPESLWQLADDARPHALLTEDFRFRGAHSGYDRLGVRPIRTIALDPELHLLVVHDEFETVGTHRFDVPFHLAPGVDGFEIRFRGAWERSIEDTWVSPSYGVRVRTRKLVFSRSGEAAPLTVVAAPGNVPEDVVWSAAERLLA